MRHLRLDPTLVVAVLALAILGTVIIFSASAVRADMEHGGDGYYYFKRQIFFLVVGILALVVGAAIPYEVWQRSVIGLLALTVFLLVLVLTPLGHKANNA
ncbi:FtsW/RodA/SpoVE family cell cycle protein, partial [bacterium]|nr:FtsW/RodA/SpoVE family cell cycle protein [bacterium]